MKTQGALPLVWHERYDPENYIVADCNEAAFNAVKENKFHGLLIIGAAASGKTHLAHIFQQSWDAFTVTDETSLQEALETDKTHILLDSADLLKLPEEGLFHLVNLATLQQKHILITAAERPAQWIKLPDLLSRLQAFQQVELQQPDEEIIKASYQKMFIDRGLNVDNKVLDYLALRSERSFAGIKAIVEKLDVLSLEQRRKITIPLITDADLF